MKPTCQKSARGAFAIGVLVALGTPSCSMTYLAGDSNIGPEGGVVTDPASGSWLLIPAGALASATRVSLETEASELQELDGSLTLSPALAIGPASTTLAKPAVLTLRFGQSGRSLALGVDLGKPPRAVRRPGGAGSRCR